MSILRKSINFLIAALIVVVGCAKSVPLKIGEEVKKDSTRIQILASGKIYLELEAKIRDVEKEIRCTDENKLPRIRLRKRTEYVPMFASCSGRRVSYVTFVSQEAGVYEIVARGGKNVELKKFSVRYGVIYDNPDFNSGGDEKVEGAKKITIGTEVQDTVYPAEGNATNLYMFDAPKGYVTIKTNKRSEGEAEVRVYERKKNSRGPELAHLSMGENKVARLPILQGSYLLEVKGRPASPKLNFAMTLVAAQASPTKALMVADIYKESDGRVTALFASKDLKEFSANAKLDIYRAGSKGESPIGTCVLGAIAPSVTTCVIEKPDGNIGAGSYFAKPSEAQL